MFKIMLALHLLTGIFAIGPLVHAATTAGRGVRQGDGTAVASAVRLLRIYAVASVLVVVFGFGLSSAKRPNSGTRVAEFSEPFIWVSLLIWLAVIGLVLGVMVPRLEKVSAHLGEGKPVASFTAAVAACGAFVGVAFAVIVFLMVYRPGS